MNNNTKEYWDREAKHYATLVLNNPDENDYSDRLIQFLKEHGAIRENFRTADIGCGAGKYCVRFARDEHMHVTAVDISGVMLGYVREFMDSIHADYETVECDFREAEIRKLGWKNQFDLVFANMTPAVRGPEEIRKMTEISRGYCFLARFADYRNLFAEEICVKLGMRAEANRTPHGENDTILNDLKSFRPETVIRYEPYNWFNLYTPQEALDCCYERMNIFAPGQRQEVGRIIESMKDENGIVKERVEASVLWALWEA